MNWFNKGKGTRIPNEAQAPFGTPLEYFKKNLTPKLYLVMMPYRGV